MAVRAIGLPCVVTDPGLSWRQVDLALGALVTLLGQRELGADGKREVAVVESFIYVVSWKPVEEGTDTGTPDVD